uniref:ATP synthase F0 subunit 8 n=1 Tax=Pseudocellus pearsei TaxID=58148 RepID=A9LI75_9ARAC|nr:ATP synthase F0 subunit 8 [Pseudocellus pearsei]ABS71906.1 ATP synthase F0 subunit 8 [Pseudocellus pearsei]
MPQISPMNWILISFSSLLFLMMISPTLWNQAKHSSTKTPKQKMTNQHWKW